MVSHYTATLIEAAVVSAGVSSLHDVHVSCYTAPNTLFRVLWQNLPLIKASKYMWTYGPSSPPSSTRAPHLLGLIRKAIQADLWLSTLNGKVKRMTSSGSLPLRTLLLVFSDLRWTRVARLPTQRNIITSHSIMSPHLTYIVAIWHSSRACVKNMIHKTSWVVLEVLGSHCESEVFSCSFKVTMGLVFDARLYLYYVATTVPCLSFELNL